MKTTGPTWWGLLEHRRAMAFLGGGVLRLTDTTLLVVELVAGVSILGTPGPLNPILYTCGTIAACVGLLGFYPPLADRAPWTARVSGAIVTIAGTTLSLLLVWFIAVNLLNQPDPPFAALILSIIGVAFGFVLFGVGGVGTGVPSRTVGVLLLAVVATLVGWIALGVVVYRGAPPAWTSPAVGAVLSVLLIVIGPSCDPFRSRRAGGPQRRTHLSGEARIGEDIVSK